MKKTLQAIVLGATLLAMPLPVVSQQVQSQKNVSIEIKPGIKREDALNNINLLKFRIDNLSSLEEYDAIVNNLSKLIEYGPDREIQYKAHFLMASVTYQRSLGWGKKYSDESFSHLERDIIQYSDQEKIFGLAADALAKISEKLAQQKFLALIKTTKVFELYNMSPYPKTKEGSSKVKGNLDQILNTPIGGLTLTQALQKMFYPDGIDFDVLLNLRKYVYANTAIFPVPEQGYVWNNPITDFKELRIQPYGASLPALIFKNSSSPFTRRELGEQVDVTEEVKEEAKRQGRINLEALSDAVCLQLNKRGISTHLGNLENYFSGGQKNVIGLIYPIIVKSGISIKNLLTLGGIDPYNWIYKGIKSGEGSLKDLKW